MIRYIGRRFLYMVLTLWVIVTLTFIFMHMLPGDPFNNPKITPEIRANLYAKYGLDQPLWAQYLRYIGNLLHGDFGISYQQVGRSVNDIIASSFPASAELGLYSLIFAVVFGLLLGITAALRRGTWWDSTSMVIAVIGTSVPSFILGALLQYLIAYKLGWLPVAGWDSFAAKIIPSISLGMLSLATVARLMRASVLDVIHQDYIRTARAKGLSEGEVALRHILRNAILPVVTVLGPMAAMVLTGSFVIETIFNIPGMGKYFVQSVVDNDYTIVMGTTVFYAGLLVIFLFVVDVLYGWIDPRIRLGSRKE